MADRTNFRFVPLRRGNAPIASRRDDRDLNPTFLRIEVRVRVSFISRLLRACLAQPEDHHQCNRHVSVGILNAIVLPAHAAEARAGGHNVQTATIHVLMSGI